MTPAALLGWTPFSYPFNLTQQPACTIPCGLTSDGLPIGLQLVGPMFGDALVLRAARAYESVRPIARPHLAALGAASRPARSALPARRATTSAGAAAVSGDIGRASPERSRAARKS